MSYFRKGGYSVKRRLSKETNDNAYLMHYGVSGMKKGQRRYQTEDGQLTAEGREHYGVSERKPKKVRSTDHYSQDESKAKKWLANEGGAYAFAKWRERRHDKNLAKAKEKGNEKKIAKYESKKKAQAAANADLAAYRKKHTGSDLLIQNIGGRMLGGLYSKKAAHRYRHARARGASMLTSLVEGAGGLVGLGLRMHNDKKKYGKHIVYSALDENMNNIL